ncbi:hypothetical protein GGS26DRAFT_132453 [Hypomontagnella submonticulosa]|nr:hypothetical protein GGS26DRAFT_132453 [Hypomontagnella submonticulosa]
MAAKSNQNAAAQPIDQGLRLMFHGFRFSNKQRITGMAEQALLTLPEGVQIGDQPEDITTYQNCLYLLTSACSVLDHWKKQAETDEFESAIHDQWPLATPRVAFFAMHRLVGGRRRFLNRHDRKPDFPITALA